MAKILMAKVGTDAHDMGITVVERWLSDAGHDVVNLGLYNTPDRIAAAAVEEQPDIIGLSFLGGEPVYLARRVLESLSAQSLDDVKLVVGGVLTPDMIDELQALGVAATFPPGTRRETILEGLTAVLSGSRRNTPSPGAAINTGAP